LQRREGVKGPRCEWEMCILEKGEGIIGTGTFAAANSKFRGNLYVRLPRIGRVGCVGPLELVGEGAVV